MTQRLLQSRAATIAITVTDQNETPVDADTNPTVTVTDGSGAVITGLNGAATTHGTTGVYTRALTATQLAVLDQYTATWAVTRGGVAETLRTSFEVVGGFMFSVAEARAFDNAAMSDPAVYPTATILSARDAVAQYLEELTGVAFAPHGARVTVDGRASKTLFVPGLVRLRRLISASVDGTAVTVSDVDVYDTGKLYRNDTEWACGYRNVVLHLEHGWDACPPEMSRAALRLLRHKIVASNIDDRAIAFTDELGTRQLAVAGGRFGPIGIPDVDAAVAQYTERLPAIG